MKKIIALVLVLALLPLALAETGGGFASDYAAMNAAAGSALIVSKLDENGSVIGTYSGFVAFDGSHAITTCSAVTNAAALKVVADDGTDLGAVKVLGCDSECNLAIIAFDEPTGLEALELNESGTALRGSACVSIGAQDGVNAINTGNISNLLKLGGVEVIQFTAPVGDDFSGGALFDANGLVVGVTMLGINGEIGYAIVQNMNFAVSVSHLIELWNYCREDEPVALNDWFITDISPESAVLAEKLTPHEITITNKSGYSITDFIAGVGDAKVTASGWIKDGETTTLDLTKFGDDPDARVYITFLIRNPSSASSGINRFSDKYSLGELWGQTFEIDSYYGAGSYYSPNSSGIKASFTRVEPVHDIKSAQRRHTREALEVEEAFTLPKTIDVAIPREKFYLINESSLAGRALKLTILNNSARATPKNRLQTELLPGEMVELDCPEDILNWNDNYIWIFELTMSNGRYLRIPYTMICDLPGSFVFIRYDEDGQLMLELVASGKEEQ